VPESDTIGFIIYMSLNGFELRVHYRYHVLDIYM
jgi:hypothetical protein